MSGVVDAHQTNVMSASSVNDDGLRLIVSIRCKVDGIEYAEGETVFASGDKAFELLCAGAATLHERQLRPPIELLNAVEALLDQPDIVGEACLSRELLEKFQNEALRDGRRQAYLGAKRLVWVEGHKELKRSFDGALELHGLPIERAIAQLKSCWKGRVKYATYMASNSKLEDQEMIETGVACIWNRIPDTIEYISGRPAGPKGKHYEVGSDWAAFFVGQRDLRAKLSTSLKSCLETGRILTVEERANGARLLAPWQWEGRELSKTVNTELHFLFSGDLPHSWFKKQVSAKGEDRQRIIEEMVRDLQDQYEDWNPGRPKVLRRDFVKLAVQNYGCSKNSAHAAWKAADIPGWKKSGAPRKYNDL